jgi:hypothetical protein
VSQEVHQEAVRGDFNNELKIEFSHKK